MKNKIKKIYIIIPVCIVIIAIVVGSFNYNNNDDNAVLNGITSKEYNNLLKDSEQKLVYIGRPTCADCVEVQPILEDMLEAEGLTAYYYNTDKAKKKSMNQFNDIKETVGVQYVPTIIYYNNGEEISRVEYSEYKGDSSLLDNLIAEYKENIYEIQD